MSGSPRPPVRGDGARTCVIALGSHQGDDRAAWICAEPLRGPLTPIAEVVSVVEPIRLLDYLEGRERLLVLDACRSGAPVGSVLRLRWPDPRIGATPTASSHLLGLAEVLHLAETLGKLPPRVVVFGLEIASMTPGAELSPAVAAALPALERSVLEELGVA